MVEKNCDLDDHPLPIAHTSFELMKRDEELYRVKIPPRLGTHCCCWVDICDHGLLEETGHATPNLCKIKCGPTFELPNLVLNLGIFRQTFFSRSLEMNLVLREKVIFFLRTTPAALGRVLSDQVVFSPKTASCFE